jgi:integrase
MFRSGIATKGVNKSNGKTYYEVWWAWDSGDRVRKGQPSLEAAEVALSLVRRTGEAAVASGLAQSEADSLIAKAALARDHEAVAATEFVIESLAARRISAGNDRLTVTSFAKRWFSGELSKLYPDQIRMRPVTADYESMFTHWIQPCKLADGSVLGDLPLAKLTSEHARAVMVSMVKAGRTDRTRRHGWVVLSLIGKYAEISGALVTSPIQRSGAPKPEKHDKNFQCLYPDEDTTLMACTEIDVVYRLFWGINMREGFRREEQVSLRWRQVDLDRGLVKLGGSKTGTRHPWALQPGTVMALATYKARFCPDAKPDDYVFKSPAGSLLSADKTESLAPLLREHLRLSGLASKRPELGLTKRVGNQAPIRHHDLRATFVTISKSLGMSDDWVAKRTGHQSREMIAHYTRVAESWAQARLAQQRLVYLNFAIPELRPETMAKATRQLEHMATQTETIEQAPKLALLRGDLRPAQALVMVDEDHPLVSAMDLV